MKNELKVLNFFEGLTTQVPKICIECPYRKENYCGFMGLKEKIRSTREVSCIKQFNELQKKIEQVKEHLISF